MAAPQPITIRYGDNGLLGQAAAQIGAGQRHEQDRAIEMDFINNELARRSEMARLASQNKAEAIKLQTAAQSARQSPSYSNGGGVASSKPDASAVNQQLNQAYVQRALAAGVEGPEAEQLKLILSHPNADPTQVSKIAGSFEEAAKKRKESKQRTDAKRAFFDGIKGQFTQDDPFRAALEAEIENDAISTTQFKLGYSRARAENQKEAKADRTTAISNLDKNIRDLTKELLHVEDMARLANVDLTNPSALNPVYDDAEGSRAFTMGPWDAAQDATFWPQGHELVSGGDTKKLAVFRRYARLQNEIQKMKAQRDQLAGDSAVAGVPSAAAVTGGAVPAQPQATPDPLGLR